jgi:predicted XRE-type DNA-binding protein
LHTEPLRADAAKRFGVARPRRNDLLRRRINKFTLDALSKFATRVGLTVKMSVRKTVAKWTA